MNPGFAPANENVPFQLSDFSLANKKVGVDTGAWITRVLDKHIHPAHTFYDIMLQMTQYALNEKHNEYA